MHSRATVDSMASDSYLLQVPCSAPPCQCKCQCHSKHRSSTPCGVVVALVVLLAAVMTLAALAYCQRMDLLDMHGHVEGMHREFRAASSKLDWLHKFELIKTYETLPSASTPSPCGKADHDHDVDDDDSDLDEDDRDYDDEYDPVYQDMEDTNVVEGKALSQEDGGAPVPVPLEPASGHRQSEDPAVAATTAAPTPTTASTATTPSDEWAIRRRRDVRQAGRPQPQLKLYHMLQTPGLSAAAPPPDQWSPYSARYPQDHRGRPQPMYAEHAPMAYVTPPQRRLGTSTAAPVASRRSRVMDGMVVPTHLGPQQQQQQQHRRRHQQHQQQRQWAFQHQQQHLQDVTQEVPQGGAARSVEVGRPRWQQQQQQLQLQQQGRGVQAQPAWPSSTQRPSSSWSPTERPGWREPWQDRVRAPRVPDSYHR